MFGDESKSGFQSVLNGKAVFGNRICDFLPLCKS